MILPTIHTNGTAAVDLLDQYREARHAILAAYEAVAAAAPNGRDYYPQGATAHRDAMWAHSQRLVALDTMADEMLELAQHAYKFVK